MAKSMGQLSKQRILILEVGVAGKEWTCRITLIVAKEGECFSLEEYYSGSK